MERHFVHYLFFALPSPPLLSLLLVAVCGQVTADNQIPPIFELSN